MTISLCMIVKNEEEHLSKCLDCVKAFVDEIIIVDTGSDDNTKAIAQKYTDKIYDFEWKDDFSAARNFSFSKASMDYIMWLDADDIIRDEDIKKIVELKSSINTEIDAVIMKYGLDIDEYNHITQAINRERIVKRNNDFKWVGLVHEYLQISGNILHPDICIIHDSKKNQSYRNLKILKKLVESEVEISPRNIYYYAMELKNNGQHDEAFEYYKKFLELDNPDGMYVCDVCLNTAAYYMKKGKPKEALRVLIRSMETGIMRPEILCYIGNLCKELKDYEKAVAWYELIFQILIPKFDLEIHSYELGGFIPCLDLSYCCFMLGKYDEAVKYNEMAAKYKPDDPIIKENREKFRKAGLYDNQSLHDCKK